MVLGFTVMGGMTAPSIVAWALAQKRQTLILMHLTLANYQSNLPCELTFAGFGTLGPRVIKLRFSVITTLVVPSTAGSTTAELVRFLCGAALRAYDTGGYCNGRHDGT